MNIQWYPGHMTKAKRMMQENIKLVDIVIELVDARVPLSSMNPDMPNIAKDKPKIMLLNKVDLADPKRTDYYKYYFEKEGYAVACINSRTGNTAKQVPNLVKEVLKEKIERNKKRGLINKPMRCMVVGIPNVGKSTFINQLVGKASAKTGNKPGVTKGKQWIKLKNDIELLDTPGILWPKFEDQSVGIKLALIGSIREEILDVETLATHMLEFMKTNYESLLKETYPIENMADLRGDELLEKIAEERHCYKAGQLPDTLRMAVMIMEEFKNGKLGRITLE